MGIGVSNQPLDVEHLEPVLEHTIANPDQAPQAFIAYAGCWGEDNAMSAAERGVDPPIPSGRRKHGQPPPPSSAPIPNRANRRRLGRKQVSQEQRLGIRRLPLGGLEKMNDEWMAWCLTDNIKMLLRFRRLPTVALGGRPPLPVREPMILWGQRE